MALQPANITTGSPVLSTGEGFNNSSVVDWYTYFEEPIVYITTSITQDHVLTADSFQTGNLNVSPTALTENSDLFPVGIVTGSPSVEIVSSTIDYGFSALDLLTGSPALQQSGLSQKHDLSVVAILSGQPVVSSTGLIALTNFQANDLVTGVPELGSPTSSQIHNLQPNDKVTGRPSLGEPVDPNAIALEIGEIKEMFGGWPRRNYEVPDGRLVQAEREIDRQFGQKVSVDRKAKSLIKFGKSAPLVTGSLQTVWTLGGNETYVSGNTIDSVSSSSSLDTEEVYLECHTVDESGNFTFLTQVISLNGQNRVALPTPVARVSMIYNNSGTNLAGRVVVYENTALNNGIPTDVTKIHIDIPLGFQESFKAATTFSSSDYFILTGGFGSVSNKQAGAADFYLEIREQGKVFRQVAAVSASASGPWNVNLDPAVVLPKNSDIRVRVETEDNNLVVFSVFQGYLAKIL